MSDNKQIINAVVDHYSKKKGVDSLNTNDKVLVLSKLLSITPPKDLPGFKPDLEASRLPERISKESGNTIAALRDFVRPSPVTGSTALRTVVGGAKVGAVAGGAYASASFVRDVLKQFVLHTSVPNPITMEMADHIGAEVLSKAKTVIPKAMLYGAGAALTVGLISQLIHAKKSKSDTDKLMSSYRKISDKYSAYDAHSLKLTAEKIHESIKNETTPDITAVNWTKGLAAIADAPTIIDAFRGL